MSTQIDLNSFDNIYNDTYKHILKYVICKCSNLEDVNDIIQDTYVEFYKILKRKTLEIDNINSFVIGIANNKIKKYYGLKYKIKSIFVSYSEEDLNIENMADDTIDLEGNILNNYDTMKLWDFIKKKKAIIGQIFYLYYELEYTIKDISKEMNITESAVKNHLYRTLKELEITFKKERD